MLSVISEGHFRTPNAKEDIQMKQHKMTAMLLAVCTLLSFAACGEKRAPDSAVGPTASDSAADRTETCAAAQHSTEESSTSAETGAAVSADGTVTAASDSPVSQQTGPHTSVTLPAGEKRELLHRMTCLKAAGGVTGMVSAGGTKTAVSVDSGRCCIVDLAADRITAEVKLICDWERVIGINRAGTEITTLLADQYDLKVRFYDTATGKNTGSFDGWGSTCYEYWMDPADDTLYGKNSSTVCKLSHDGKETLVRRLFDPEKTEGLLEKVLPGGSLACVSYTTSAVDYGRCTALVNLNNGKERFRVYAPASDVTVTKSGLVHVYSDNLPSQQSTVCNCTVYDIQNGKQLCAFGTAAGSSPVSYADPQSRWMLLTFNDDSIYRPKSVVLCDTGSGKTETLSLSMKNAVRLNACYLPGPDCFAFALSEQKNGKSETVLYRIDPSQAKLSAAAQKPYCIGEFAQVGSALAKQRKQADAIERKYGVRILIGDEVRRIGNCSGYRMVSTEDTADPSYTPFVNTDTLNYALDHLDRKLARYPKDFFKIFMRGGYAELQILIPLRLDENGGFAAAGIAFEHNLHSCVAMEVSSISEFQNTVDHEIFHAVEYVMNRSGFSFDEDEWQKLNPAGFTYCGLDNYFKPEFNRWTVSDASDRKNAYFIRNYGCSTSMEDRATIAEYCFTECSSRNKDAYRSGSDDLKQNYPHLAAKLDAIEQQCRACFGSSYLSEIAKPVQ